MFFLALQLDEAQQTHLYLEKLRYEEGEDEVDKGRKSRKEAGLCVGELMEPRVDVSQLMAGRLGVLVSHKISNLVCLTNLSIVLDMPW